MPSPNPRLVATASSALRRRLAVLFGCLGGLLLPGLAWGSGWPGCQRGFEDASDFLGSPATLDLYHGLMWLGGAAGVQLGGDPERRWSSNNAFDESIRSGLRIGSRSSRERADTTSDVFLGLNVALLPAAAIGHRYLTTADCVETWDMVTDAIESFSLTIFVTESIKLASGRTRPYEKSCEVNPANDARCNSDDRYSSFVSGHASLAAAGAGLTCAYSVDRRAFGESMAARALPCALGAASALATGVLRISSDRHWGSDVLAGFAMGALIGYFDTWGPLDLLRFDTRKGPGRDGIQGAVMPMSWEGALGARLSFVF